MTNSTEDHVDTLLKEFDAWFQQRGNQPMVRSERAILKTFCWFLINDRKMSLATATGEEKADGT